jgi:integrase/recombinase XerC
MMTLAKAKLMFEEFMDACEYDYTLSYETVSFYRNKIERFLAWLEEQGVQDVDAGAIRSFFRWLKDRGVNETTRHTYYRALRRFFRFLKKRKLIDSSPLEEADIEIRPPQRRPELPTREAMLDFVRALRRDIFPPGKKEPDFIRLRDCCLVLFLLETGARRREALIKVSDLRLDLGHAVTTPKVRDQEKRFLYFHSIKGLLKLYLEERAKLLASLGKEDEEALWITRTGEPVTPQIMNNIFRAIRKRYGWQGRFHPHLLRAYSATLSSLLGDRTALELRMGWKPNSIVARRYIQWGQEEEFISDIQKNLSPLKILGIIAKRHA